MARGLQRLGRSADVSWAHLGGAGKGWCGTASGAHGSYLQRATYYLPNLSRSTVATGDLNWVHVSEGRPLLVAGSRKGGDTNFWRLVGGRRDTPAGGKRSTPAFVGSGKLASVYLFFEGGTLWDWLPVALVQVASGLSQPQSTGPSRPYILSAAFPSSPSPLSAPTHSL